MAPVDLSYYNLLCVSADASPEELSSAYRKQALKLHPDKGGNEEQFKAMKAAYDVLKDPQKRQLYDSHGPAVVRAMDGEVLEPEVFFELAMYVSKVASRMVLCIMPFIAVLTLFPAVALSLKWDGRVSWNWNIVFIPMWFVQIISLLLVLKLRSSVPATVDGAFEGQDDEDSADSELKKDKVRRVFTVGAGLLLLLIAQEALLASQLQGYTKTSWFLIAIPYALLEMLWLYLQISLAVAAAKSLNNVLDTTQLCAALVSPFWWAILRIVTVALLAAKADTRIVCAWMWCLMPLMIGAGLKLIWACRPVAKRPPTGTEGEEEEEVQTSNGFASACFAVTGWLSMMILAACKLDGSTYSAFIVFLPFFIGACASLCCCTCLACCGPIIVKSFVESEQEEQDNRRASQRAGSESQSLNPRASGGTASTDYSTMPQESAQPV